VLGSDAGIMIYEKSRITVLATWEPRSGDLYQGWMQIQPKKNTTLDVNSINQEKVWGRRSLPQTP
uniref:hypothetical protein n=1 Tax=Chryseobacterium sp. CCH4-E10 TaxID=1768758 RepID=UPI000AEDDE4B